MYRVCLSSLYFLTETPRNATGHGRGRGWHLNSFPLLWVFFNPSVLRTPPLYFAMQNTEEEVNTFLIRSYISCLFFSLAVSRSITGCCVSHIEKVARSDGGVEKHHLNQSVYIRYLTPSPYTPPISPAMSRGRVEFILLHCVFVAQKYKGDTEER